MVPFLGTAVGAVIGGVISGAIVDGALLKLEEAISRDDFKREILEAIREARADFKLRLFGTK